MDLDVCMGKKRVTGRKLRFVCYLMIILLSICKAVPSIMILVDGLNELAYFEGISGKEYNVTCKVIATKPILSMTWTVNDVSINTARLVTENQDKPETFDIVTSMTYNGNGSDDIFNCTSTRENYFSVEQNLLVKTYVLPELRLQVGNVNVTRGDINVTAGESLVIQCIAFSARSVGVFLWTTSDGHVISGVGDVKMSLNRFYNGTFDVEDEFIFIPRRSGILSCTHQTEDHEEATVSLNIIIMNDNNAEKNNMNVLAISLIVSSVAAVFVIAMCFRLVKGLHAHANVRFDHQQEAIGTLPGTMTLTGRRPPSMKLPEKPSKQTSLEVPDFDDERYHSLFDDAPEASIIDRKRVCLLTRISEGVIFQRWMGTFTKPQGRKEYITISLRNDTINQSRYNWEMFAKKIIELPGCRHIAECVGLCLDGEKLLVLQSYSHSVDLHSYLSKDNKADESNFTSRRLQLASQVLLGMEFLVSHG
ncbi:hypothetical protein BSL78_04138, partial [Apostichopus japonicus]